jgi:hypothetical protein
VQREIRFESAWSGAGSQRDEQNKKKERAEYTIVTIYYKKIQRKEKYNLKRDDAGAEASDFEARFPSPAKTRVEASDFDSEREYSY